MNLQIQEHLIPQTATWNDFMIKSGSYLLVSKNDNKTARSFNYDKWDIGIIPEMVYKKACVLNDLFVLFTGKEICYSLDGLLWIKAILPDAYVTWLDITFFAGYYIINTENSIKFSKDLVNWQAQRLPQQFSDYTLYANNNFLYIVSFSGGRVYCTKNFRDFEEVLFPAEFEPKKVECGAKDIFIVSIIGGVIVYEHVDDTIISQNSVIKNVNKNIAKISFKTLTQNLAAPENKTFVNKNFDFVVEDFTWDGQKYIVISKDGKIYVSFDANTWSIGTFIPDVDYRNIKYLGNDTLIALYLQLYKLLEIKLVIIPNGINFSKVNDVVKIDFTDLIAENNAVSYKLYKMTDGQFELIKISSDVIFNDNSFVFGEPQFYKIALLNFQGNVINNVDVRLYILNDSLGPIQDNY